MISDSHWISKPLLKTMIIDYWSKTYQNSPTMKSNKKVMKLLLTNLPYKLIKIYGRMILWKKYRNIVTSIIYHLFIIQCHLHNDKKTNCSQYVKRQLSFYPIVFPPVWECNNWYHDRALFWRISKANLWCLLGGAKGWYFALVFGCGILWKCKWSTLNSVCYQLLIKLRCLLGRILSFPIKALRIW